MPWEACSVTQKRKEFVLLAGSPGVNLSQLASRFGISRKTAYKWLERSREQPQIDQALQDRSRRPRCSPRQSLPEVELLVLQLRQAYDWGGRKISHVLSRDHALQVAPSTVTSILHRHGQIRPEDSNASKAWLRFEHARPNELWQMDFKGDFPLAQGRCYPLTAVDDHSRFNLILQACSNQRRSTVQAQLERAFAMYGLPERINTDNGPPWGTGGQGEFSMLGVWLMRLGIKLSHSTPWHPQSNGKDERFHRSLKRELLRHHEWVDLPQAQVKFDDWRHIYNEQRPHEALEMQTPVQRYRPSKRSMPSTLPEPDYEAWAQVRKVQHGGWVHFQGREIRLSKALAGQPVAFMPRPERDGAYDVYFCQQHLKVVHLGAR